MGLQERADAEFRDEDFGPEIAAYETMRGELYCFWGDSIKPPSDDDLDAIFGPAPELDPEEERELARFDALCERERWATTLAIALDMGWVRLNPKRRAPATSRPRICARRDDARKCSRQSSQAPARGPPRPIFETSMQEVTTPVGARS